MDALVDGGEVPGEEVTPQQLADGFAKLARMAKRSRAAPYMVVELSGGYAAIIDRHDWRRVKRHSWHVHVSRGAGRKEGQPYARTNIKGKKVYLHRFVLDAPPELHVDHKNHQTLDCRRINLEQVTHAENMRRRRPRVARKKP
jgi:hypothetical protein